MLRMFQSRVFQLATTDPVDQSTSAYEPTGMESDSVPASQGSDENLDIEPEVSDFPTADKDEASGIRPEIRFEILFKRNVRSKISRLNLK